MKRALGLLLLLALVAAVGAYVWRVELGLSQPQEAQGAAGGRRGAGRRGGGAGEGPVAVLAEPSRRADVPVILEAVGTAQALNTVTVRSQVDGRLMELAFREGQDVRKGDILARIDPTIYQAQYDQAVAKKAQDQANLANARLDLERYANLAKTNYGSKQQADTQRAAVAQLEAQVQADQGAVDNARAYLDYTTIRSPLDGRIGIRLVDQGNIIRAGDTTGLVVITQLKPIAVIFNLPQQNLRAVNAALARGPLQVEALEADNRGVIDTGALEVVDNQVDQTTGTVKLKAAFPNERLQLWPGSFVNVRLTVDVTRDAVVVPTAAVQRGPNGAFVYGVEDGKAVLKPVTIARQTETVSVVTAGIVPPDLVITTGFARLTDGDAVRVADPAAAASDVAPQRRTGPDGAPRERRRRPAAGEAAAPAADGTARAPEGAAPVSGPQPVAGQPPGTGPAPETPAPGTAAVDGRAATPGPDGRVPGAPEQRRGDGQRRARPQEGRTGTPPEMRPAAP